MDGWENNFQNNTSFAIYMNCKIGEWDTFVKNELDL